MSSVDDPMACADEEARPSSSSVYSSLDQFQVEGLLGRGKYSQVYAAKHLKSGANVALKKVQIFDMIEPNSRQDCLKEVKILGALIHPNIVRCYNSFIHDSELIIVMEWAQQGDLAQLIKGRAEQGAQLRQAEVWSLFGQVCAAVQHMHDRRMMHRDLKPGNIFVMADGCLKLGDLGLSRYFSSRTLQATSTVGTPYYMSPEAIKGQPYDFSSDIWALGCLLYELVTLRNPFFKAREINYIPRLNLVNCLLSLCPGPLDLHEILLDKEPHKAFCSARSWRQEEIAC